MKSPEPITICISCPGGEVNAGLAIYDLIQSCSNKIYMYCIGQACSMAAVLLAAGQKGRRYILPLDYANQAPYKTYDCIRATLAASYARHLLRQPPLECDSTPSEGFLAVVIPICFFFNQTGF